MYTCFLDASKAFYRGSTETERSNFTPYIKCERSTYFAIIEISNFLSELYKYNFNHKQLHCRDNK